MNSDLKYHLVVAVLDRTPAIRTYTDAAEAQRGFHELHREMLNHPESRSSIFHLRLIERHSGGGKLLLEVHPNGRLDTRRRNPLGSRNGLQDFFG